MLTERQQETIKHLERFEGIKTPKEIVDYCLLKLSQPHRSSIRGRKDRRKRSKEYYQEIIAHFVKESKQGR